ncbi:MULTISPECIES: RNA polymerase sigma-70 factor [Streptacidiphilus]|uniref:RNA polymerase sigma-70 factor n=1 Tax=Streptacidiphilus cavernicola TaxID=3342716 RepID=A0ABV6UJ02_9ACTN|nr:RNA polymerase sigma-70 factor [Streptacidiphilus jeojiense]
MTTTDDQQTFADHRNLLFSVAYRLLGTAMDAEDVVQDAWFKWSAADRSQVADPKAYLARIATNLAMDRLRSVQRKRESYVGPWLPEPILTAGLPEPADSGADTLDAVERADSVSTAMLVVLETLSPLERAVFVLKEVFAFSYAEIAGIVERTEPAVRQAGHRAREHVQARRPRYTGATAARQQATERFLAASTGGDINALMELLAPDVTLWTDGGGKVRQALHPVEGRAKVAAWMAGVARRRTYEGVEISDMTVAFVEINGGPGITFTGAGRVISVMIVDLDDEGRIRTVHNIANPDKLQAVAGGSVHEMDPR